METTLPSARHTELARLFQAHFAVEEARDVEATLRTLTDDIVYEHPLYGEHPDREFHGLAAAADYYRRTWSVEPFRKVWIERSWLCGEDTLIAEVHALVGRDDQPEKHVAAVAIGVFRDGLLAREIVYNEPPPG